MGRRAKNKQGPPQPLKTAEESSKSIGKRKADSDGAAARPTKKLKDSKSVKPSSKSVSFKSKPEKGKKQPDDSGNSSDGWEDVDDDELATKTKCVN